MSFGDIPDIPLGSKPSDIACFLSHQAFQLTGGDPRLTLVVLIFAAAQAGQMVEQETEEVIGILRKLYPVAGDQIRQITGQQEGRTN